MRSHGGLMEPVADVAWLAHSQSLNPLNLGQKINNGNAKFEPNVEYQELDLPPGFDSRLRKWIPNVHHSQDWNPDQDKTRVVLLLTTKDVQNQELFSTYHETVSS
jgi:hypothetical protein